MQQDDRVKQHVQATLTCLHALSALLRMKNRCPSQGWCCGVVEG